LAFEHDVHVEDAFGARDSAPEVDHSNRAARVRAEVRALEANHFVSVLLQEKNSGRGVEAGQIVNKITIRVPVDQLECPLGVRIDSQKRLIPFAGFGVGGYREESDLRGGSLQLVGGLAAGRYELSVAGAVVTARERQSNPHRENCES